ncbi:holocytochrome c synthase [Coemansia sp. RSA 1813]|nr:holocytochrome c synthase [Coemansia sp. RSA 1646]KAJ1772956.1 holocytochrome c synthase [Coemansia sp. RSA 1843]KAJ2093532.1 holocytochrome c synthase [Coemansia sp. RSA 986]KAJ2210746.1 holocytochrome c synthase [Coemansia sp. RSA 487]KAJ2563510.1 holocytochrome c synthase [Coemansia sp. RSA 1813]
MSGASGNEKSTTTSGCPVDHSAMSKRDSIAVGGAPHGSECPADHSKQGPSFAQSLFGTKATSGKSSSGCPVDHGDGQINPLNMMPNLTQEKHDGQKAELSIDRELSSIPRATGATEDKDNVWEYPSSQQFYNALARKNMAAPEEYIDVMVDIHNFLNEGAWNEVLKWEARHKDECKMPRLSRLQGRPRDLSPMARMSGWFHGVRPFDRHDWYVDRCGKQIRYVIDYYEGAPENDMPVFNLVVRPAIDDFGSLADRAKQLWADSKEKYFGK